MTQYIHPLDPRLTPRASCAQRRVMTGRELRALGVPDEVLQERCRPGGPWRLLLPGVYLLHAGRPSGEERLRAALLYAGRTPRGQQTDPGAMVTGLAALALLGFDGVPRLDRLARIDVLVGRGRRLPDAGEVRILRATTLPRPWSVAGVACAPVPRAVADAVAGLDDTVAVRKVLVESVRTADCEPAVVVRELRAARLLSRPQVADALGALMAEGRAMAENRMYEMVRECELPDPVWNVVLRLPAGPCLGRVDAFWPDHSVALDLEAAGPEDGPDPSWHLRDRRRGRLAGLGVEVVVTTPGMLRTSPARQAAVLRTALRTADDRHPHARLVALPR